MKHKKTLSLILLTLSTLIIIITPSPLASPGSGPIIWSGDRQLTFDPVEWDIDPETGKNITTYYVDFDLSPSITATKDNKIWVVWQTDETQNDEIFYRIYNFNTGTWTNNTQLTFNPSYDLGPAVLQAKDGKIWVFWASDRTGNYDIFYKVTSDNGASWSTEIQMTNDPRTDVHAAVAQASDGKIWLVWSRETATTSYDIFYKTYNGTSWSDETQLTTNTDSDQLPSVTQAKDGKIWVFWSRYMPDTHEQICYKTFNGSTWSSETQLTSDLNKDSMYPAAFVEQDGTIWVFWQSKEQQVPATWDLFYKISLDNGATWSLSPIQFTADKKDDIQPSVTQALDKSLWVVWTSNRLDSNGNSNVDLYHKVSLLGDLDKSGIINTIDFYIIGKAMATTPAWPSGTGWNQWNSECDLNIDNIVDIEDLAIATVNYGKHV